MKKIQKKLGIYLGIIYVLLIIDTIVFLSVSETDITYYICGFLGLIGSILWICCAVYPHWREITSKKTKDSDLL